jgi:DNA-binding CsgD family transcriptional regulator
MGTLDSRRGPLPLGVNFHAYQPRNAAKAPAMRMAPSSAVGFLLLDSSLRPISFNAEAVKVLTYPDQLEDVSHPDIFLTGRIRSRLLSRPPSPELPLVTDFQSGRRRYLCRAFVVDWHGDGPSHPNIAVLLERGPSGQIPLSQVSQQFNLTQRERGALEYLLQGLSSKQIASRMNVSPNTVKAFLRLIMIKMGVSSRSAIVGRIFMTRP